MKNKEMEDEETITRDSVLKLMEKKNGIESQLRELKEILDCNNIGMKEPLVDREGYPRQDIDVYQVRHARHNIIRLQNDHKALMNEIEKGLHILHAQGSANMVNAVSTSDFTVHDQEGRPFAKIIHVDLDSPAHIAGLQIDDLVLSFGSVNFHNFKSMQDIASVVQHSVNQSVSVIVRRNSHEKRVTLVPKGWKGKGLLGCVIVAMENVDR